MQTKKLLKRLFFILFGFIIVAVLLLGILAASFEDKIGEKVVSSINEQITTEMSVGDFDLSVLKSFPNIGANLKDVQLLDKAKAPIMEVEELSFRLSLLSLLTGKIKLQSVVISDGAINIFVDKKGRGNYDIAKTTESESESSRGSGPKLKLKKARLRNIEFIYQDESTDQSISTDIQKADFSGNFSAESFALNSDINAISRFVDVDAGRFLAGTHIHLSGTTNVNIKKGAYDLKEVKLQLEENIFELSGFIKEKDKNTSTMDLKAEGKKISLASILNLIPSKILENAGDLRSKGDVVFLASIVGDLSKTKTPEIKADLQLQKGSLSTQKMDGRLKDVSFTAHFNNGKSHTSASSTLNIANFRAYYHHELMQFDFSVKNLDDPYIHFEMDGAIPMDMIHGLIPDERVTAGTGEIEITDFILDGKSRYMTDIRRISKVKAGGQIDFDDAGLTINGESLAFDKGRLTFDGNELNIQDLKLEGAGSEIYFDGKASNLVPVLFANSLNTKRAELKFHAKLRAPNLDLDRLMKLSLVDESKTSSNIEADSISQAHIEKRQKVTNFLNGTFDADIASFNYNKIEGRDFKGKLSFDNNELKIDGVTFAMGGSLKLDGKMYFESEPYLHAKLTTTGVSIQEFFRQGENFGQEVLRAEHVSGKLNSKMAIHAYWDNAGNFDMDKLHILAGIGLTDGYLKNFEMLESFSSFVKIKDLKTIKFTNLENFFEIRNQKIYIPAMFIQSNAMNLTVSGEHSFENDLQYYLQVNAGQVLINKFKAHDYNLNPQKAKKKGFFNLYYSLKGNLDDYHYQSDKKGVQEAFYLSKKRKERIQRDLEKEFGFIDMVDETAVVGESPVDENGQPVFVPRKSSEDDDTDSEFMDFELEGGGGN